MRTMVLEYLPTFTQISWPSFGGKYTSTMEHMGNEICQILEMSPETKWLIQLPETREDIQHMHWGNDQSPMNWGTTIP